MAAAWLLWRCLNINCDAGSGCSNRCMQHHAAPAAGGSRTRALQHAGNKHTLSPILNAALPCLALVRGRSPPFLRDSANHAADVPQGFLMDQYISFFKLRLYSVRAAPGSTDLRCCNSQCYQ
jgi:hypothetical protein